MSAYNYVSAYSPEHDVPITISFFLSHTHIHTISYITSDVQASQSFNARVAMVVMTVSIIIVRHDFYAPCIMFCQCSHQNFAIEGYIMTIFAY